MMGDPVRCLPKVVHPDVAALKLQHNPFDSHLVAKARHSRTTTPVFWSRPPKTEPKAEPTGLCSTPPSVSPRSWCTATTSTRSCGPPTAGGSRRAGRWRVGVRRDGRRSPDRQPFDNGWGCGARQAANATRCTRYLKGSAVSINWRAPAPSAPRTRRRRRQGSKGTNPHVAELHRPFPALQCKRSVRMIAVLNVGRLDAVEDYRQPGAPSRDVVGVPLARGRHGAGSAAAVPSPLARSDPVHGTIGQTHNGSGCILALQMAGGCHPPSSCSTNAATASTTSSRPGGPMICTPIGRPSGDAPPRTTAPGQPVTL